MSYELTFLAEYASWQIRFADMVDLPTVEQALSEAADRFAQHHTPCGLIIDWREILPLNATQIQQFMAVFGEWVLQLHVPFPIFAVFLCQQERAQPYADALTHLGLGLPIFEKEADSMSYLSLKISSADVKSSLTATSTQFIIDPTVRLELIAAAQEARIAQEELEQDETARFPMRGVLRLEASGMDKSILVFPDKGGVLGRRDSKGQKPDVDLSLWSGFHSGVSRRHAEIRVGEGDQLYIIDLDSTNGTFINGQQLQPNMPYLLRHSDEIRLGSLVMHVYFQTGKL